MFWRDAGVSYYRDLSGISDEVDRAEQMIFNTETRGHGVDSLQSRAWSVFPKSRSGL